MDLPDRRETNIDILIALHATKCRLATLINARQGRGEATADLDAQLAANRAKAGEMARFLRMNPNILGSFTTPS
ncbi:hypothetical protein HLB44_01750 [Aquincola sp. S2]|uniref:Uncharacterized protein n=1 Tax=Pseudaquabacterium terrae TaxID=2732868 RepID=A0ABX2EA47_9BURK|nr:hypothetical protein [Aquabacterium terrae]NRF65700.1 hypothetical protein [Aquabacterium terrae]